MSAKNPVDPNRHDKLSKLPGTPHVRKLASSYNDSGLHEDSGFISPPTLVKFEAVTPHGYNLRHMTSQAPSRWSSTPLNLAPDEENLPTPGLFKSSSTPGFTIGDHPPKPQLVEIVDFKSRLDSLEHHESDSGYDSLLSDSSISRTPRDPEVSKTEVRIGPSLGAIPKRRSPRQLAKARKPDVERLARLKNINFKKNLHEAEATAEVCHSASRVELRTSREGKETLDIIKNLAVMNLSHVIGKILVYSSGEDLCKIVQVSNVWRLAVESCHHQEQRRCQFLDRMKIERENFGVKLQLTGAKRISPRRKVLGNVANIRANSQVSPTSVKRDRNPSSSGANLVSPSKIRLKLFMDQAKTLTPEQRLVHCPLCTSPSRVSLLPQSPSKEASSSRMQTQRAECSSPKCHFSFCPDCQCQEHPDRPCPQSKTTASLRSSKVSGGVTSKKSKARLRRL